MTSSPIRPLRDVLLNREVPSPERPMGSQHYSALQETPWEAPLYVAGMS